MHMHIQTHTHTQEALGFVPYFLLWLRYTGFIVLYPLGVASELTVAYLALPTIKSTGGAAPQAVIYCVCKCMSVCVHVCVYGSACVCECMLVRARVCARLYP